jgi:hypothetical protein
MLYWNPSKSNIESWEPSTGWNSAQSESEKIMETNLFFFFKNKKGFSNNKAEVYARMVVFKYKYHNIQYSDEEEEVLQQALQTVFS